MSYKTLDPQDFLVSADSITAPCWSNYTVALDTFYTSAIQLGGASGNYYANVYNLDPSNNNSELQFNIAYANKFGSGSQAYSAAYLDLSPTRTIYGQWRNMIYGDENSNFSFGGVTPASQSIYVITIDRSRYKQSLLPGSLNLTLSGSGQDNMVLTDNSLDVTTVTYCDAGRVYEIVSGSNGSATDAAGPTGAVGAGMTRSGSYGLFLPDIGAIILNDSALRLSAVNGGIALPTSAQSNTSNDNFLKLFDAINGGGSFQLNSQETVTSDFIFCRARNGEFNYSENPSFISGSTGAVLYDLFVNNPTTYITTIGLYNNSNELLAVAKLSKPLPKDFTKEALVRVKLDF
jgi:hypothetical protein